MDAADAEDLLPLLLQLPSSPAAARAVAGPPPFRQGLDRSPASHALSSHCYAPSTPPRPAHLPPLQPPATPQHLPAIDDLVAGAAVHAPPQWMTPQHPLADPAPAGHGPRWTTPQHLFGTFSPRLGPPFEASPASARLLQHTPSLDMSTFDLASPFSQAALGTPESVAVDQERQSDGVVSFTPHKSTPAQTPGILCPSSGKTATITPARIFTEQITPGPSRTVTLRSRERHRSVQPSPLGPCSLVASSSPLSSPLSAQADLFSPDQHDYVPDTSADNTADEDSIQSAEDRQVVRQVSYFTRSHGRAVARLIGQGQAVGADTEVANILLDIAAGSPGQQSSPAELKRATKKFKVGCNQHLVRTKKVAAHSASRSIPPPVVTPLNVDPVREPGNTRINLFSGHQAWMRLFPDDMPLLTLCPKWYTLYPLPTLLGIERQLPENILPPGPMREKYLARAVVILNETEDWKSPTHLFDLYTPRLLQGVGRTRAGLCPICYEEGVEHWAKTKTSNYNYHMLYVHGINPATGLPFYPPMAFRTSSRPFSRRGDKSEILQGHCSTCKGWVDVESIRPCQVKVPEIYWWKHAQQCQGTHGFGTPADAVRELRVFDPENELYCRYMNYIETSGDPFSSLPA